MKRRKIIPLKFDSWTPFALRSRLGTEFAQPLMAFAELKIDNSRQKWIAERAESQTCQCCGSPVVEVESKRYRDETGTELTYFACSACGFWRRRLRCGITPGAYLIPSIREFDPMEETPSLSHLAGEISKHPEKLYRMEPYRFERFVGSVFRDYFNCEVYHVGQSGDDGIDLYAIVKDEPFLIQVKRRSQANATEGVNVVKLLFASAFAQGGNQAAVVTTAQKFSRQAREWAKMPRLSDISFNIQLVDFPSLMSMVNCVAQKGDPPPWIAHKESSKARPLADEHGWIISNHDEHDVLLHGEGQIATALIFEHRSLEDCVVLSGATEAVASAIELRSAGRLTEASAKEIGIRMSRRRNDTDLESAMAIPFRVADDLSSRWKKLYPDIVLDSTP